MPTSGTRYFRFDAATKAWQQQYSEDLSAKQRARIVAALEDGADALGYRPAKVWGPQIEDRGTQVTFSALGQKAPADKKKHPTRRSSSVGGWEMEADMGGEFCSGAGEGYLLSHACGTT